MTPQPTCEDRIAQELRKIVEEEGIVIVSIDPPPPPSAGILIQDGPS